MDAKRARKRFFIMAALSAVLGAAFYFLLHVPLQAELRAKEAEASGLRREMAETAAFRRNHPDPQKEEKQAEERKRMIEGLLPPRLDEGAFLAETEKRAAELGVELLGFAPGNETSADGVVCASARLSVRGAFFALLDFLYALEQQGRFVRISAVRGKADENGVFTGTVELWMYARTR